MTPVKSSAVATGLASVKVPSRGSPRGAVPSMPVISVPLELVSGASSDGGPSR